MNIYMYIYITATEILSRCQVAILLLTYYKVQYLASKCDRMERVAYELPHILWAPTLICSRTMTEINIIYV